MCSGHLLTALKSSQPVVQSHAGPIQQPSAHLPSISPNPVGGHGIARPSAHHSSGRLQTYIGDMVGNGTERFKHESPGVSVRTKALFLSQERPAFR